MARTHLICAFLAALTLLASASAAHGAVVLNEVNCEGTDWVELVNTAGSDADISGWLLTDDPLDSTRADHRHVFPAATTIPAHGDLVVEKGTGGFPFGISCGNDTVRLADGAGAAVDTVAVPALTVGTDTWGRYPNASGPWVQTAATKSAPNEPSSASGDPGADQAAWLFDPSAVVGVQLTLPQSSVDALAVDPGEYQDATFSLTTTGGTYGPIAVGVRLKGGLGSFRPLSGKAGFKLKFNHSVAGQRFLGLKKLTLNSMVQDPSMIHEALAYEAFRAAGLPAPRTGYAYVSVNDQEYGLYLNLETLDDVSLPRWFGSTHHLYEGEYWTDVVPQQLAQFEVDEGSDSDRSDLEALAAAAASTSGDWSDGMNAVADLGQMTRMWAAEKYIGHWDGYSGGQANNYYLHSDASGRFRMLPWGTDQTWQSWRRVPFDAGVGKPQGFLLEKCLADGSCRAMYREAVKDVSAAIGSAGLDGRAVALQTQLAPFQADDPRREHSSAEIAEEITRTRAFIAARPGDAEAWLNAADPREATRARDTGTPKTDQPAVTISKQSPGVLRVPRPRLSKRGLTTELSLPAGGEVRQRATVAVGKRRVTICLARARKAGAGELVLRCTLTARGRRLVRAKRPRVTMRTWFDAVGAKPVTVRRAV